MGQMLRAMASTLKVGFHIVHHTRKVAPGITPSIDDARGGSALRGTCRFNRVLVAMMASEATAAGVDDCRYFFRIGELETPVRANIQARNWGGYLVMQVCRFPITTDDTKKEEAHKKARAKKLINTWIESGVIKEGKVEDNLHVVYTTFLV